MQHQPCLHPRGHGKVQEKIGKWSNKQPRRKCAGKVFATRPGPNESHHHGTRYAICRSRHCNFNIYIRLKDCCFNFCVWTDFPCAYQRSTSFIGKSRQAGTFVQRNETVFATARHSHHLRDAQRDEVFKGLHQGVNEVNYIRHLLI